MDGVELIYLERQRQLLKEGFTAKNDDSYLSCEMAAAAKLYIEAAMRTVFGPESLRKAKQVAKRLQPEVDHDKDETFQHMAENPARDWFGCDQAPKEWPWDKKWWKPSPDAIRNLVKAGALIAAEIDRLQRLADIE